MEAFIYVMIFIMGIYFGSFFTLAVYRIPKGENITYKHSYCPNCNHKLGIADLVPVFSYIFLGAKCRYCKQKIRPRYFILEILSGISFVLFAMSFNIDFLNIETYKIVYFVLGILYFSALVIIAGIDREKHMIQKSVLLYGIITCALYMIYSCTINYNNVYAYVIYLCFIAVLLIIDNYFLKRKLKENYIVNLLILLITMVVIYTLIFTLLATSVALLIDEIKNKRPTVKCEKKEAITIPFAFYTCVSYIAVVIVTNFIYYFKLL